MNCKPNDLAVIVISFFDKQHIGKIVTIKHIDFACGLSGWKTEPSLYTKKGQEIIWDDRDLRPIRPGETPEESTEAMKKLHHIPNKETA